MQLTWTKLLNPIRRKDLNGGQEIGGLAVGRTQVERDYDRVLFATPTRRLADKTQVFPMEKNNTIRTRLTHSFEVSNLARSIGTQLAFANTQEVFGADMEALNNMGCDVRRDVPAMLAAVGLAHDLGNPPFGHQGEKAMQQWFATLKQELINLAKWDGTIIKQEDEIQDDFLNFDGNAQTLRLLTRLQILNDDYGLNLTVGTLGAVIKYPTIYGTTDKRGFKKHGVFSSETNAAGEIWNATGLSVGIRHPLVYVMEACDDIAYSVIDAEDTVKKGYASYYDLISHLEPYAEKDSVIKKVLDFSTKHNLEFRNRGLSSKEVGELSMQMFRVSAISELVPSATKAFVANIEKLMSQQIDPNFDLIDRSDARALCEEVKKFDHRYGISHREVLKLELDGSNYIKSMMDMLWSAIKLTDVERKDKPFERYVYGSISENYRRIFEATSKSNYEKYQLLCDTISGMTESYLIEKHDEFKSLQRKP